MDDDDVAVQGLYYGSLPARDVKNAWEWTLDALGNWGGYREKANGEGTPWDLDQTRLSNKVNEIDNDDNHGTAPSATISGGTWILPVYDAAGNMTEGPSAPRPADWTTAEQTKHKYVHDAWNRLVKVTDNSNATIALYRYDGLGRRIARLLPNGETWDRTDYYYDESWQVLEERFAGGVSDANKDTQTTVDGAAARVQWLWDVRYIDAPVLRWRDTDANGSLDETLYYCNDANMNVTALVSTSGAVVERYLYDPYGKVSVCDGVWSAVTWANSKQNEVLFCGYRFDPESGLYHVRHRHYHPTLGRWTTRDPIQYRDGLDLYHYVASNPVGRRDPSGLFWSWPGGHTDITGYAAPLAMINLTEPTPNPACRKYVQQTLLDANRSQDSQHAGDLRRHYNREAKPKEGPEERITNQQVADAAYQSYLSEEQRTFNDELAKGPGGCAAALDSLGRRAHSLEDFYAHAIRNGVDEFDVWANDVTPNSSSPSDRDGLAPSTYPGEHVSYGAEPGSGPEQSARFAAAAQNSWKEYKARLEEWWKVCGCWCNSKGEPKPKAPGPILGPRQPSRGPGPEPRPGGPRLPEPYY